ncbi:hypothetical protein CEUSTIGMA_g467.t1 [Chlamydomonas eustigma]|uniref:Uncharacterized protein n=1 Tax=Chlamydomonas eustigma TaxID=1157962 RepID=A0A250WQ93_9CHLO|nr:hypothetical protein CEUSTIGMA_g467.t1 [Chlamydomonas eustigma]|eukprot:GAX73015.1 hypothetical protein CEUSTIGMA_g467.t1 [Chlamydomonas eustigma]
MYTVTLRTRVMALKLSTQQYNHTMEEINRNHAEKLVQAVAELGIVKLGKLVGRDPRILKAVEASKFIVLGNDSAKADWPELWSKELGHPVDLVTFRNLPSTAQVVHSAQDREGWQQISVWHRLRGLVAKRTTKDRRLQLSEVESRLFVLRTALIGSQK